MSTSNERVSIIGTTWCRKTEYLLFNEHNRLQNVRVRISVDQLVCFQIGGRGVDWEEQEELDIADAESIQHDSRLVRKVAAEIRSLAMIVKSICYNVCCQLLNKQLLCMYEHVWETSVLKICQIIIWKQVNNFIKHVLSLLTHIITLDNRQRPDQRQRDCRNGEMGG